MTVRTRFAPSPTGYLHIGGARTALFSWAYARKHGGTFILRIEDTDVERSTPEAVQAILDGMKWLELNYDEGPFYQMQRMDRYKVVIQQMIDAGQAYYCYTSPAELDAMREAQRAAGEKPRYDGKWRPESGKTLPPVPADIKPVVRFKTQPTASFRGKTWSRAPSNLVIPSWMTSSSPAPMARQLTTSASWLTTGTWVSPKSSVVMTT